MNPLKTSNNLVKSHSLIEKIEHLGNKFPHPFFLFILLSFFILIIAALLEGTTFILPQTTDELVITSLLNREGFVYILSNLLTNFIEFPLIPLIVVFTMAIGVGEQSGIYQILITKLFSHIPTSILFVSFMFLTINGNLISDAALILFPTIGALLFINKGKSPLLAITMSYAGYLAGLSANSLLAGTDVLCTGITESVLNLLPATTNYNIHTASNWYFMFVSAILLAICTSFTTAKFVEPRINALGWTPSSDDKDMIKNRPLSQLERKGLQYVLVTTLIYLLIVIIMLQSNGWLVDSITNKILPDSPFINNITVILAFYFFLVGLSYGIGAKTIHSTADVGNSMASSLNTISSLLVVFFFAAQFTDYFNKTNLAPYIALLGSNFLLSVNFTGLPLLIVLILFTSILNFFIGTVGAKWSVMAPILVPMMALLGYSPAFAQCIYRIGDSITNTINPISVYLPIMLIYMKKYNPSIGIGTIITLQIPYAITFLIVWILQISIWYLFNLPLGPMASIFL